jgi:hypothetical protein
MRSTRSARPAISLLMIILVLLAAIPTAVLADDEAHSELLASSLDHPMPRTDGEYVVFQDEGDIYGAYVDSDEDPFAIATGPEFRTQPDVDNGIVVWAQRSDPTAKFSIRGKNLSTGATFTVANNAAVDEVYPAISGNRVAWIGQDQSGYKLMVRDIGTMATPITIVSYGLNQRLVTRPAMDGDWIVWARVEYVGEFAQGFGIYATRVGSGQIQTLGGAIWDYQVTPSYDVGDGKAVYVLEGGVFARNLITQQETTLRERWSPGATSVTTDGRFVFFEDRALVPPSGELKFRGYDLQTRSLFVAYDYGFVMKESGFTTLPNAAGGFLVWQEAEAVGEYSVWSISVMDLIPTASFEDPGMTSPAWFYFKETGHYLSYGFKDFWVRSGGLPVFGFPLTIEYDEFNVDLGLMRTVQYLERQRFEYHPELAGTPYETLLGRLGAEDARQRGITSMPAFQPVSDPRVTGVDYFAATGHTVRGRFRDYWRSRGLDFGDPGVSHRESLALFGYPISEEFTDPATGLVTQYFERAVFEYHPDNPEPYKVLLRRLGAEELQQRDW